MRPMKQEAFCDCVLILTLQMWSSADLLESEMLASETAPISYPGVAFEDEVAEPCFTTFGKLVEKARMIGQAYEKHRYLGLPDGMTSTMLASNAPAATPPSSRSKSKHDYVDGKDKQSETSGANGQNEPQVLISTRLCCSSTGCFSSCNEQQTDCPVMIRGAHVWCACRYWVDVCSNRSGRGGRMP